MPDGSQYARKERVADNEAPITERERDFARPYGIEAVVALLERDRAESIAWRQYLEAVNGEYGRRPRHPAATFFEVVR
jgi:hypothetical protein